MEILKAEREEKAVIFLTIIPVINMLVERYDRIVHVVRPEDGLKEEYRQQYRNRGNSGSFLSLFIDSWEEQMESIGESRGIHHRLKSGEYLTPLAARLLEQEQVRPAPVSDEALTELEHEIEMLGRDQVLLLWGMEKGAAALPVKDIDRPETREFLERIGKAAYDGGMHWINLYPEPSVRGLEDSGVDSITWFDREELFLDAVVRESKAQL